MCVFALQIQQRLFLSVRGPWAKRHALPFLHPSSVPHHLHVVFPVVPDGVVVMLGGGVNPVLIAFTPGACSPPIFLLVPLVATVPATMRSASLYSNSWYCMTVAAVGLMSTSLAMR